MALVFVVSGTACGSMQRQVSSGLLGEGAIGDVPLFHKFIVEQPNLADIIGSIVQRGLRQWPLEPFIMVHIYPNTQRSSKCNGIKLTAFTAAVDTVLYHRVIQPVEPLHLQVQRTVAVHFILR